MSFIVSTQIGRFRKVVDKGKGSFLFECPDCKEWLPMLEEHLDGTRDVEHLRRDGTLCSYRDAKPYGAVLVSTMQARLLMAEEGVKPYDTDYCSLVLGE